VSNPSKPNIPPAAGTSQQADLSTGSGTDATSSRAKAPKKAATEAASEVTRDAQEVASQLAGKAREGLSDAKEQLRSTAEEQKDAGADRIKHIAGAVSRAADALEGEIPEAAHYVRRAAKELGDVSEAVKRRDVNELIGMVQDFARRQPTAFIGASVIAGFAAVRFLKTSAEGRSSSTQHHNIGGQGLGAAPTAHQEPTGTASGFAAPLRSSDALTNTRTPTPASGPGSAAPGGSSGVAPEAPGLATKPVGSGPSRT